MSFTCQYDCLSQVPRKFYVSRSRSVASTARGCTTFPNGKHDDQADSTSQALDWAKQCPSRPPLEEFHERQLLRWRLGLDEEYIFKQCDEGEEIIAAHFTTGHRIRWNGQYWEDYN